MWNCKCRCIPTCLNAIINWPAILSRTCVTVPLRRRRYNIEDWPLGYGQGGFPPARRRAEIKPSRHLSAYLCLHTVGISTADRVDNACACAGTCGILAQIYVRMHVALKCKDESMDRRICAHGYEGAHIGSRVHTHIHIHTH